MKKIIIENKVFELVPGFQRGVVIARNVNNKVTNDTLHGILVDAAKKYVGRDIKAFPQVLAWDNAHRLFGSNPNKYPPSVKALLKRASSGKMLPFVNSMVAIMNIISLRYAVPCGGDDLNKIQGNLILGVAGGNEQFSPLGETSKIEYPTPGEIIYYDSVSKIVMCRRWNWRNGDHTKLLPSTRNLVMNIDCLPPNSTEQVKEISDELGRLLYMYCGAEIEISLLNQDNKEVQII